MTNQKQGDEREYIELQLLLSGIHQYYGYDFRDYQLASIRRRVWHRMKIEGIGTISQLQDRVLRDTHLMDKLFQDFTINVTEMFRDSSFFYGIRTKVIPQFRDYPRIKVWHAGCATGEEAYSLAILLLEAELLDRAVIYATDVNQMFLNKAKEGMVPVRKMRQYTRNYIAAGGCEEFCRYYDVQGEYALLNNVLQKSITFAQHNLVTDQSFNEFDLIICRNVLIYFSQELQQRVHRLLLDSLAVNGFIGLGSKEDIAFSGFANHYCGIDQCARIYRRCKQN